MLTNLVFLILDLTLIDLRLVDIQHVAIQEFNQLHITINLNLSFLRVVYGILLSFINKLNEKNPSFFGNQKFNIIFSMYKGFIEKLYKESKT